jgi:hypothetical protein
MHYPHPSGARKNRLNRVFDAIGFVYPDYRYPLRARGKKRKAAASAKTAASATPDEPAPKSKKLKVLTHRPRYIEPAVVLEFGGEASSAADPKEPAPHTQKIEESAAMLKASSIELIETKVDEDKTERSKTDEATKMPGILSPSTEATVLKAEKSSAITPRRKRMVNVLDILETTDSKNPAPIKRVVEAVKAQTDTKQIEVEAATIEAGIDSGPSEPSEKKSAEIEVATEEKVTEQISTEKITTPALEALKESIDYIIRHASGKRLSQEEVEAQHYTQKLKYLKGALVFNGSGEEDYLYCLPDSKEISICREMGRSFGFPKLEDGLSTLSKDELADSLAYNSIKL